MLRFMHISPKVITKTLPRLPNPACTKFRRIHEEKEEEYKPLTEYPKPLTRLSLVSNGNDEIGDLWRVNISRNLQLLYFYYCDVHPNSKGLIEFLSLHYPDLKQLNPLFTFAIRPYRNHPPVILAQYDFNQYEKRDVPYMTPNQICEVMKELVLLGKTKARSKQSELLWGDVVHQERNTRSHVEWHLNNYFPRSQPGSFS